MQSISIGLEEGRLIWFSVFSLRPKTRKQIRSYKQLSQEQRYQIEILKKAENNQTEIAELRCVSSSTICKEMQRNKGYRPKPAQIKAVKRRKEATKAMKMTAALILLVEAKIIMDWSPEQISGSLRDELGKESYYHRSGLHTQS